jgi:hypothetical protein
MVPAPPVPPAAPPVPPPPLCFFGHENLDYLQQQHTQDLLIAKFVSRDLISIISAIHFDSINHPENCNVRRACVEEAEVAEADDASVMVEVYDINERRWVQEHVDEVIKNVYRILRKYMVRKWADEVATKAYEIGDGVDYDDLVTWLEDLYLESDVRESYREDVLSLV